jgi:hypothetical protein
MKARDAIEDRIVRLELSLSRTLRSWQALQDLPEAAKCDELSEALARRVRALRENIRTLWLKHGRYQ